MADDVKPAESSPVEEGVTPEQIPTQEEVEQEVTPSVSREVKSESEVDERGVPLTNVYHEFSRKLSEQQAQIQQLTSLLQQQQSQTQPTQPKYSKAQLQAYLQTQNLPVEQRIWALEEIDKFDKEDRRLETEKMFEEHTKRTQGELQRQQAYQWFAGNFPECFIKDANGGIISIDNTSPLVQKVNEYMSLRELQQNSKGLEAAVKMAAFDLGYQQNKALQRKVNITNAQLKREQKKTLIAGGGIQQKPGEDSQKKRIVQLAEEYRKTRNPELFKELAKARGLLPPLG